MKNYIVYNGQTIPEGSIVTVSSYPDTKWILHDGWYRYHRINYIGWYLNSIPDNQVIPVTEDVLDNMTVVSKTNSHPNWTPLSQIQCIYGVTQYSEIAPQFNDYIISVVVDGLRLTATKLRIDDNTILFSAIEKDLLYEANLSLNGWSEVTFKRILATKDE